MMLPPFWWTAATPDFTAARERFPTGGWTSNFKAFDSFRRIKGRNILDALRTASPAALDVNSGVESSPGKKDHVKIARIMQSSTR
jgi:hypothetical protein